MKFKELTIQEIKDICELMRRKDKCQHCPIRGYCTKYLDGIPAAWEVDDD